MNDTDQQRNPAAPISAATYRTLRMARHLEITAPGVCVPCAKLNRFLPMTRTANGMICARCGYTRGN